MIVSVRDVVARCVRCGETDFRPLDGGALRLATVMRCVTCGRDTTYRDLLDSIGEEAMRRANEALAKLKKNSPKRRRPRK
ncbi:MAG TPA: hypothetical protein VE756_01535 [Burkholderiales bacterium]|jgi:hypothetical protein|nr:hypothetical protein [Burkholderiales bacterium]